MPFTRVAWYALTFSSRLQVSNMCAMLRDILIHHITNCEHIIIIIC